MSDAAAKAVKSFRINIKSLVFAPLLSDDKTACTYGDVDTLAGLKSILLTPTIAAGEDFNDGAKDFAMSKTTGYELALETSKIPVDKRAIILGHTINNKGILVVGADDQPIDIAVGYEIENDGSKRELVWLLKGKMQPYGQTLNQSEKDIKVASDSTKIIFVARDYDRNFQAVGDTSLPTFTDEEAKTFLDNVPTTLADTV